jgi:hypothetical protein
MGREWVVSAILAVAGITVFKHFEEKTPRLEETLEVGLLLRRDRGVVA